MTPVFHSRNFALFALFSFLTVGIFCLWSTTAMGVDDSSRHCAVYGNDMALCGTDTQSHISAWKNFLNIIPQKTFDLLLLAFLLVFVSATHKTILPRTPKVVRRFRAKELSVLAILDPIKRALARGIIQPQIYDPIIG